MLSFPIPAPYLASRCYVTYGTMAHLDPEQPPSTQRKPWAAIASQHFVHKVDLIIPEDVYEIAHKKLVDDRPAPVCQRVVMALGDVLSGAFFTEYIKLRSILMLSQGRMLIDNVFTLRDGKLHLYLDRETYERAGLVGKPHGVKGKRDTKPRWVVEFDLHSPTMVPGKKGFERLMSACRNVFSAPITWLFCDLSSSAPEPNPLLQYSPVYHTSNPSCSQLAVSVTLPQLKPDGALDEATGREEFEEFAGDIYEWLSLVRLESPRLSLHDNIDPFLSMYKTPGDAESQQRAKIRKISWEGLLSSSWTRTALIDLIAVLPSRSWFSFSTTTFPTGMSGGNSDCTILRPPNTKGEYIQWEVRGHEG
ncbi:ribonuclease P 40kDa subunit [Thozetella sp. PMI_491]|nr:ribonuclease P 40kDa subunit [Thozetella sp. PMI_491]